MPAVVDQGATEAAPASNTVPEVIPGQVEDLYDDPEADTYDLMGNLEEAEEGHGEIKVM